MRQGQQNRRGRGRSNHRKGGHQNPLSRSFESNGPNERIRGTPSHIAEKYVSLAREAQSSGDPVLAENYLQHAEHYSRIIMAYREQLNQPGEGMNGGSHRVRMPGEAGEALDDFGDDQADVGLDDGLAQPMAPQAQAGHQRPQGGDHGGGRPDRQDRRPDRQDRPDGKTGSSGAIRTGRAMPTAVSATATATASARPKCGPSRRSARRIAGLSARPTPAGRRGAATASSSRTSSPSSCAARSAAPAAARTATASPARASPPATDGRRNLVPVMPGERDSARPGTQDTGSKLSPRAWVPEDSASRNSGMTSEYFPRQSAATASPTPIAPPVTTVA